MVITDVNQVVYQGDGATTAFPFTFRIIDATDIKLLLIDADGTETDITSDYFVDTNTNTVYYPGYAPGAEPGLADQPAPVQEGQRLVVYRELPVTQEKDLGEKWPFFVIELALDKLTMILQQIKGWWDRCLKISPAARATHPDFDMTFPVEAGKSFRVNAEGTGFEVSDDPGIYAPIAIDAANRATAAAEAAEAAAALVDVQAFWFDSVADMKAANLPAGETAGTKGYDSINDGDAALYAVRAKTEEDVEDGDKIIFLANGNVAEKINDSEVQFLFPANKTDSNWDCEIIVTNTSVLMIDSGTDDEDIRSYLVDYMVAHGIKKVDYFLLTHYHSDHDGNIIPFLNQSVVDFSQTKWYLPNVTLGFESHKTAIISALQTAGATYEVLTADKTVQLSPSVTMDIMGANADYIQFIDDNIQSPTDLNPYSLCAMITHKDVKAFYTGDIGWPATQALQEFYDLPKVDVLKVPHHGANTSYNRAYDAQFYAKLEPEFSTTNVNHYEFIRRATASAPFSSDKREHIQFAYANGSEIWPLRFGDVEIASNGDNAFLLSGARSTSSYFNETPMIYYVDASYTDMDCDGSEEHPFPDLNALIDSFADRQFATGVYVNVAAGTYPSLILTSFPAELSFNAVGGTVYIGNVYVKNCPNISFFGGYAVKALQVVRSNATFSSGTVTVTPDDTYTHIYDNNASVKAGTIYNTADTPLIISDSMVYMVALSINGANMPDDYNLGALGHITKSLVSVRNLTVRSVTKPTNYVLQVQYGSVAQVDAVDIDTTTKVLFRLQFASMVLVDAVTMGEGFTAALYQNNGGYFGNNGAPVSGTTAQRPDVKTVPNGYTYLDTTVGCLIVKIDNAWYKATNGTVA